MFRAIIIGNLGSDAHVEQNNGRPFISFSVAHNDRFVREDGTVKESLQWISCAMNGDGGKLLQFLKKGRSVYVEGRATTRVYSSEKERRMVAGVNISVDHLELIGGQSDEIPSRLIDTTGVMHDVRKAYYLNETEATALLAGQQQATLLSQGGQRYLLNAPCWITLEQAEQQPVQAQQSAAQAATQGSEQEAEIFGGEEPMQNVK